MIEYNTEKGSKPFIFCKKNLTLKEADNFTDEYILAKKTSLDQDVNLRNLADRMESNLEFVGNGRTEEPEPGGHEGTRSGSSATWARTSTF
jgi:hypothetical protein